MLATLGITPHSCTQKCPWQHYIRHICGDIPVMFAGPNRMITRPLLQMQMQLLRQLLDLGRVACQGGPPPPPPKDQKGSSRIIIMITEYMLLYIDIYIYIYIPRYVFFGGTSTGFTSFFCCMIQPGPYSRRQRLFWFGDSGLGAL